MSEQKIHIVKGFTDSKDWIVKVFKHHDHAEKHKNMIHLYNQKNPNPKKLPNPYDPSCINHCWTNPTISYGIVTLDLCTENPSDEALDNLLDSLDRTSKEADEKRKLFKGN
jgi:hypothetical protein